MNDGTYVTGVCTNDDRHRPDITRTNMRTTDTFSCSSLFVNSSSVVNIGVGVGVGISVGVGREMSEKTYLEEIGIVLRENQFTSVLIERIITAEIS